MARSAPEESTTVTDGSDRAQVSALSPAATEGSWERAELTLSIPVTAHSQNSGTFGYLPTSLFPFSPTAWPWSLRTVGKQGIVPFHCPGASNTKSKTQRRCGTFTWRFQPAVSRAHRGIMSTLPSLECQTSPTMSQHRLVEANWEWPHPSRRAGTGDAALRSIVIPASACLHVCRLEYTGAEVIASEQALTCFYCHVQSSKHSQLPLKWILLLYINQ